MQAQWSGVGRRRLELCFPKGKGKSEAKWSRFGVSSQHKFGIFWATLGGVVYALNSLHLRLGLSENSAYPNIAISMRTIIINHQIWGVFPDSFRQTMTNPVALQIDVQYVITCYNVSKAIVNHPEFYHFCWWYKPLKYGWLRICFTNIKPLSLYTVMLG